MDSTVEYKCTKCQLVFYRQVSEYVIPKQKVECVSCKSEAKIVNK